jgi:hypothetical protein
MRGQPLRRERGRACVSVFGNLGIRNPQSGIRNPDSPPMGILGGQHTAARGGLSGKRPSRLNTRTDGKRRRAASRRCSCSHSRSGFCRIERDRATLGGLRRARRRRRWRRRLGVGVGVVRLAGLKRIAKVVRGRCRGRLQHNSWDS